MAIYQLIRTLSLNPEEVEKLTTGYENALIKLQLSNRTDPITTIIAQRIIEAAKTGVRDPRSALRNGHQRPQGAIGASGWVLKYDIVKDKAPASGGAGA